MSYQIHNKLAELFQNGQEIDLVVKRAVRLALKEHKELNNPVAGWDGNSVIVIPPEEIPSSEEKE